MSDMPEIPKQKKNVSWKWAVAILVVFSFFLGAAVPMIVFETNNYHPVKEPASETNELDKVGQVYDMISERWYFGKDDPNLEKRLVEQAISGMTYFEEDPHTNYLDLEQSKQFANMMGGSGGVGLGILYVPTGDESLYVKKVFIGSAAEEAGLQSGDLLLELDGKPFSQDILDDLSTYINDRADQGITLTIERNGKKMDVDITPSEYSSTVSVEEKDGVGIITLTSFAKTSGADFAKAVKRLQDHGIEKVVIDLRDNSGGTDQAVVNISSSLLPQSSSVFTEELKDGTTNTLYTNDEYRQVKFDKVYILQNENTASASEVLIGALKAHLDDDQVETIGTNTYGKGTEQTTIPFDDGTSIKFTIAKWYTPDGININGTGFEPDVRVDLPEIYSVSYYEMKEDEVIKPDTVAPNAKAAQIYLKYLGYDADRSDTYFSPESSEALKKFQKDNGLEATGEIDWTTLQKLAAKAMYQLSKDQASDDPYLDIVFETEKK